MVRSNGTQDNLAGRAEQVLLQQVEKQVLRDLTVGTDVLICVVGCGLGNIYFLVLHHGQIPD